MRGTRKSHSLPLCTRAAVTKRDIVGLHLQPLPEDGGSMCYELQQGLKRFGLPSSRKAGGGAGGGVARNPKSPNTSSQEECGNSERERQTHTPWMLLHKTRSKLSQGGGLKGVPSNHEARFQSSVFFKIKITHCLETIYTRVTKNSRPGISIHRFVNYTHMVTSVLAKKFLGNIHKAL